MLVTNAICAHKVKHMNGSVDKTVFQRNLSIKATLNKGQSDLNSEVIIQACPIFNTLYYLGLSQVTTIAFLKFDCMQIYNFMTFRQTVSVA